MTERDPDVRFDPPAVEASAVTPIVRDPARLAEALPWYGNGTLSAEDRAWVEARLAEDPAAAEEADFDRLVAGELKARLADVPAGVGWEALLARARADRQAADQQADRAAHREGLPAPRGAADAAAADAAAAAAGAAGPAATGPAATGPAATGPGGSGFAAWSERLAAWSERLTAWLERLVEGIGVRMTPRLATALAAVVVAQALALTVLIGGRGDGDTVDYRSGPGAVPVATIRVMLNDRITEPALREALVAHGVAIIDGPNPLGEYWLLAPGRDPEPVARALAGAGVVATWSIDHRPRVR